MIFRCCISNTSVYYDGSNRKLLSKMKRRNLGFHRFLLQFGVFLLRGLVVFESSGFFVFLSLCFNRFLLSRCFLFKLCFIRGANGLPLFANRLCNRRNRLAFHLLQEPWANRVTEREIC